MRRITVSLSKQEDARPLAARNDPHGIRRLSSPAPDSGLSDGFPDDDPRSRAGTAQKKVEVSAAVPRTTALRAVRSPVDGTPRLPCDVSGHSPNCPRPNRGSTETFDCAAGGADARVEVGNQALTESRTTMGGGKSVNSGTGQSAIPLDDGRGRPGLSTRGEGSRACAGSLREQPVRTNGTVDDAVEERLMMSIARLDALLETEKRSAAAAPTGVQGQHTTPRGIAERARKPPRTGGITQSRVRKRGGTETKGEASSVRSAPLSGSAPVAVTGALPQANITAKVVTPAIRDITSSVAYHDIPDDYRRHGRYRQEIDIDYPPDYITKPLEDERFREGTGNPRPAGQLIPNAPSLSQGATLVGTPSLTRGDRSPCHKQYREHHSDWQADNFDYHNGRAHAAQYSHRERGEDGYNQYPPATVAWRNVPEIDEYGAMRHDYAGNSVYHCRDRPIPDGPRDLRERRQECGAYWMGTEGVQQGAMWVKDHVGGRENDRGWNNRCVRV